MVVKIRPPTLEGADRLQEGSTLVSLIYPAQAEELLEKLGERKVTVVALDKVPRITRAQSMDVLSSMANLAGYRAVLEAAALYHGFFAPPVTAAGTLPPARVLVIGAGVAGLAAIAAARGLGAEVRAFDTREATKEQVESLGGKFLLLDFEESGEGGRIARMNALSEFTDPPFSEIRDHQAGLLPGTGSARSRRGALAVLGGLRRSLERSDPRRSAARTGAARTGRLARWPPRLRSPERPR